MSFLFHGVCSVVLTAAHCLDEIGIPEFVIVGPTTYDHSTGETNGEIIQVDFSVIHPDWRIPFSDRNWNDVAIMKLKSSSSNTVAKLNGNGNLPTPDQTGLFVMGFSYTDDTNTQPDTLQGANVDYEPNCAYEDYNSNYILCTRETSTRGACDFDSGGPLVENSSSDLLIGIVSFGEFTTCTASTYGGYARVSLYKPWIDARICEHGANPPPGCCTTSPSTAPCGEQQQQSFLEWARGRIFHSFFSSTWFH